MQMMLHTCRCGLLTCIFKVNEIHKTSQILNVDKQIILITETTYDKEGT